MVAQQTALYRSYAAERGQWEAQLQAARERLVEAEGAASLVAAKARQFDEITSVLAAEDPSAPASSASASASSASQHSAEPAEALAFVSSLPQAARGAEEGLPPPTPRSSPPRLPCACATMSSAWRGR